MEEAELKPVVETLLFITDHPLPLARISKIVGEKDQAKVASVLQGIREEYQARASGIQVLEIAEGFQMATKREHAPFVRKLYADKMTMRLSSAALETLSIVAYKQPITRAEIEEIRGVEVIAALETLLERRLLKVVGRKETVGRPLLYGTSEDFLRHFGLKSISELPAIDSFQVPEDPKPDLSEAAWAEAELAQGSPAAADGLGATPAPADPEAGEAGLSTAVAETDSSEAALEQADGGAVAVADPPAETEPPAG